MHHSVYILIPELEKMITKRKFQICVKCSFDASSSEVVVVKSRNKKACIDTALLKETFFRIFWIHLQNTYFSRRMRMQRFRQPGVYLVCRILRQNPGVRVGRLQTWGMCTRRAGKLYKARSRLYRRRVLQVNTRWKALAEIYTMHSFAPLSNLKIFVKNC